MPSYTRRQLRRDIIKEMILRECACQDQEMEDMRADHGVKFHHNGPEAESGMIRSNLYVMSQQAQEMHDMIGMNDDLPEWVQEKIAVASSMLDSVYDYLGYEYMAMRGDIPSHDSYEADDDRDYESGDVVSAFETGYDYAVHDMDDEMDDDMDDYEEFALQESDDGRSISRTYKGKEYKSTPAMVKAVKKGASVEKLKKMSSWADNPMSVVQAAKIVAKGKPMKRGDEDESASLDEDDLYEPWEPFHQSTGIMFFEDEFEPTVKKGMKRS